MHGSETTAQVHSFRRNDPWNIKILRDSLHADSVEVKIQLSPFYKVLAQSSGRLDQLFSVLTELIYGSSNFSLLLNINGEGNANVNKVCRSNTQQSMLQWIRLINLSRYIHKIHEQQPLRICIGNIMVLLSS